MREIIAPSGKLCVYADAYGIQNTVIDVHKEIKAKNLRVDNESVTFASHSNLLSGNDINESKLDITTWLPFAAKKYSISSRVEDYLFVPVFTIPSGIPNRNGVAFPLSSLLEFSVEHGCQGYKTFRGKPCYYEHNNSNPLEAKGVIVDSYLKKLQGYGKGKVWKVMLLLAFDRTKDMSLTTDIQNGDMNSYSMGAYVDRYTCSYCNADVGKCSHIPDKAPVCFYELNGKLVFKNMHGISGFECSSVSVPAWSVANSDVIYT